jgi:hypothetical protein
VLRIYAGGDGPSHMGVFWSSWTDDGAVFTVDPHTTITNVVFIMMQFYP